MGLVTQEAFSIEEAFHFFTKTLKKESKLIIIKEDLDDFPLESLPVGYTIGRVIHEPSENKNKSQFSTVEHRVHKGTKKWITTYMVVCDTLDSNNKIPGKWEDKASAVTAAREYTEATRRTTFVILGKCPEGFDRVQSRIAYKPSQGQKLGKYEFKTNVV